MRLGVPAASPAKWGAPGPPPAVTETGEALRFAHDGQRTDRDVVLQAVKQYGTALEFAGEGLEADKVLVLQAVTETGTALQFAHDDLRKDRDVALQTVTRWLVTESAEDLVVNATQWLLCSAPTPLFPIFFGADIAVLVQKCLCGRPLDIRHVALLFKTFAQTRQGVAQWWKCIQKFMLMRWHCLPSF